MSNSQKGFTLIELVVVIVLLGILGVTALGKFEDLSDEAASAAASGLAAELSSAAAINFAATTLGTSGVTVTASCATADLQNLLNSGSWPSTDFTVGAISGDCTGGDGSTFICPISHTDTTDTYNATLICAT